MVCCAQIGKSASLILAVGCCLPGAQKESAFGSWKLFANVLGF
jgi:hypothetical protein